VPAHRKSTHTKLVTGTLRADRQPRADVAARLTIPPKPPAQLGPRAAGEWRRVARAAAGIGTLTTADLRALELLAQTLATEGEAQQVLTAEGLTVATADGGRKAHPALKAMEVARAQAARLLAEFGLSPKARQGVDVLPPRAANPFSRIGVAGHGRADDALAEFSGS